MIEPSVYNCPKHDLGPRVPLFCLKGAQLGPRLVVSGPEEVLRHVADMLWERQEFASIQGALVLRPQGQDLGLDLPDETLELSAQITNPVDALERILSRMIDLGMIPLIVCHAA